MSAQSGSRGRPSEVKVGPYRYDIEYRDEVSESEPDLFGLTVNRDHKIIVSARQSDAALRDTVLHEVMHAIFFTSGLFREVENEERIVAAAATWLLMLLQDNPRLARWLAP